MKNEFDDFLCHHGIMYQKWGRRRFQNPDGSLTPEGRERYSRKQYRRERKLQKKLDSVEYRRQKHENKRRNSEEKSENRQAIRERKMRERAERQALKQARLLEKLEKRENKRLKKVEKLTRKGNYKKIKKNKEIFTDEELQRAFNRIQAYKSGKKANKKLSASNALKALVTTTKSISDLTGNAANIENNISKIYDNYMTLRPRANSILGPNRMPMPKWYSRYQKDIKNSKPQNDKGKKDKDKNQQPQNQNKNKKNKKKNQQNP